MKIEELNALSDTQKRLRMAELHGWTITYDDQAVTGILYGRPPDGITHPMNRGKEFGVPNYLNDLNATHQAWDWLRKHKANQFFFFDYQKNLWRIVTGRPKINPEIDYMCSISMESVINATARQRVDAILLTIG